MWVIIISMKKILFKKYTKGFTLIELLVVIAIIGILTAIITANLVGAKSKARDAKKISDLAQIQLTLEQVFDRCGKYPSANGTQINETVEVCKNPNDASISYTVDSFISKVPTFYGANYEYYVNDNNNPTDYTLRVGLENDNNARIDSGTPSVSPQGGCGNAGTVTYYYCVSPK